MAILGIYLKIWANLWIHWNQNDKKLVVASEQTNMGNFLFDVILWVENCN